MLLECPFLIPLVKCDLSEVLLLILPLVVTAFSNARDWEARQLLNVVLHI